MDEDTINLGFHVIYTLPFCPLVSFLFRYLGWFGLVWSFCFYC